MTSFKVAGHFAASLLFGGIVCSAIFMPAVAQEVSPDQILKALSPAVTRGLSVPAEAVTSDADHTFIENLRHHTSSLSLDESAHVAELAKERPQIDLNIYFNYNSAAIIAKAEPQLKELGKALSDPRLENAAILIGAHTDARGSDKYNQKLSERRAEAVRGYLVDKLKIPADNLSTAGYGKRNLKNKADPFAAENRRVQIVNLGRSNAAKKVIARYAATSFVVGGPVSTKENSSRANLRNGWRAEPVREHVPQPLIMRSQRESMR